MKINWPPKINWNPREVEFRRFATLRVVASLTVAMIVLWALIALFGSSTPTSSENLHSTRIDSPPRPVSTPPPQPAPTASAPEASAPQPQPIAEKNEMPLPEPPVPAKIPETSPPAVREGQPRGVVFVEALIQPLTYELKERWWGWRPNDLINVTDNINNFQMGVLEITRRSTLALADRISRTGSTDAYNENVERAINWFMVKADSFWFPSAESKYRDGLKELHIYLEKLKNGKAPFYTRADNLIPLLISFEDILGSCNENLVRQFNEDGSPMRFFSVDDHFFFAQGVASAMATILEAVLEDFRAPLESRNATDLLKNAISDCHRAAAIDPWIILDSDLDSIFANHRAHLAAPINRAQFYLTQLIKVLST